MANKMNLQAIKNNPPLTVVLSDNKKDGDLNKLNGIEKLRDEIKNISLAELKKKLGVFTLSFPSDSHEKGENVFWKDGDCYILKIDEEKKSFKTGNVVGFIGLSNEQLIIRSRFSPEHDYLFQYLLERVIGLQFINPETGSEKDEIFNLYCLLFPFYLKRALRKVPYQTYIDRHFNRPNLRGSLEVTRHLKENVPFMGKVAYRQRERSVDNLITELVRHTLEYINSFSTRYVLNKVMEEVQSIREWTPSYRKDDRYKVILQNQNDSLKNNGFYSEYRTLQELCLAILQNRGLSWGCQSNQLHGILFDCAWLWEEYVNTLIGEKFYHPRNGTGEGKEYLFYNLLTRNKYGSIYPDFIGKEKAVIADAKYKPLDFLGSTKQKDENFNSPYIGADLKRMVLYLWRFCSNKGFFIYPMSSSSETSNSETYIDRAFELYTGKWSEEPNSETVIYICGIQIPDDVKDYGDFAKKMQDNEDKFKSDFLVQK